MLVPKNEEEKEEEEETPHRKMKKEQESCDIENSAPLFWVSIVGPCSLVEAKRKIEGAKVDLTQ